MGTTMKFFLLTCAAAIAMCGAVHAANAPNPTLGYLPGAVLTHTVPKPPAPGSPLDQLDLARVRAAQSDSTPASRDEAFEDAEAYAAPQIITRFAAATGVPLSVKTAPILTYILARVIDDTAAIGRKEKAGNPRNRPYVGHPEISPCDVKFIKSGESYPSGHAMNGYTVAGILTEVFPDRATPILTRGLRYGQNRVVCGVHHPIDIEEGQLLGVAYLEALKTNPEFRTDSECARREAAVNLGFEKELPMSCKALSATAKAAFPDAR